MTRLVKQIKTRTKLFATIINIKLTIEISFSIKN